MQYQGKIIDTEKRNIWDFKKKMLYQNICLIELRYMEVLL